jgi:hypothetical protein
MKEMKLTKGKVMIVDDDMYEYLSQWKWQALSTNGKWYAYRNSGRRAIYVHRLVADAPDGVKVDHKNGNGLDNRRENLRLATGSQNAQNSKVCSRNKLGYKGVYNNGGRYRAQITVGNTKISLGQYGTPEEAALAYNRAAKEYFGEFANLNVL